MTRQIGDLLQHWVTAPQSRQKAALSLPASLWTRTKAATGILNNFSDNISCKDDGGATLERLGQVSH